MPLVERKPGHGTVWWSLVRQKKFIVELRWNVTGYHSFHSCALQDPELLSCKRKQVIRREYQNMENCSPALKISSSFPSTYLSRSPRPYLTSELKYPQPFTPTWNRAIKVILDKYIHEVWSAWMVKKKSYETAPVLPSPQWWFDWWWLEI